MWHYIFTLQKSRPLKLKDLRRKIKQNQGATVEDGLEEEIEVVSICKKGRRTAAEEAREHSGAFRDGQRFRAGVEGSLSVLKRAFKLDCCLFKGYKNFASSVGCAVFCHNLVLLANIA